MSSSTSSELSRPLPPTSGADKIVLTNTYWAAGAGLIPFPLADFAAVAAVNVKMLRELSHYYGLDFRVGAARSAVAALAAGASAPWLSFGPVGYAFKHLPFVGQAFGAIAGPMVAGTLTYAVGRVFTLHFGAGGSFLDFDPARYRNYFNEQLEEGKVHAQRAADDIDGVAADAALSDANAGVAEQPSAP